MKITDRLKHAWNAFTSTQSYVQDYGFSSSRATHRNGTSFSTSSYVSSIFNRIAMDVSTTHIRHVKINPDNEDQEEMGTGLNNCLSLEANIDQTNIQFIQDLVYSMFDEGVVAVVPVDTTISPKTSGGYDINTMRVGKIVNWFPKHVEVRLYNEATGQNDNIIMEKRNVAIIENPLYAIVNDSNSTLKRLIRKLSQLDDVDALASSNRLDMLISVPYSIKTDTQKAMAEKRIKDIEDQLASGRNGIAYIDGTEKALQLNRPTTSQLPETVSRLNEEFYNQLGLTKNIFDGTATEAQLRTYYSRTIDPILDNIVAELKRKFLTKTGRTQGQSIVYYRDMFRFVNVETIASLGDALRRNSVASSNEIRKMIQLRPSNDPRADELFNPNIADKNQNPSSSRGVLPPKDEQEVEMDGIKRKIKELSNNNL